MHLLFHDEQYGRDRLENSPLHLLKSLQPRERSDALKVKELERDENPREGELCQI